MAGKRRRRRSSSGSGVSSSGGSGSGSGVSSSGGTTVDDDLDHMDYTTEGIDHNICVVLDYIHGYYKEALDRLPHTLIPPLLEAGFCFGFLDPVSNIIANTISYESTPKDTDQQEQQLQDKRKKKAHACTTRKRAHGKMSSKEESEARQREMAISEITAEASNDISLVPQSRDSSAVRSSSIAARSLRGLVTFLTCYCRYLNTWDALRYLCMSKADLLVAVRLIEQDRNMDTFTIDSLTTKVALCCAAISAMHSMIFRFVSSSFSLASSVNKVTNLLMAPHRLCPSTIASLSKLSMQGRRMAVNPRKPMQLATSRLHHSEQKAVPIGLAISLKKVLLDKIHGLYLHSISCMPKDDLCSHHHRGLLKAGHCYGPSDPVTNIILNTIWFDIIFPAKQEFGVDMICQNALSSVEWRSLSGLVAFIRALFPALSSHEAMRYLLMNDVNLDRVIAKINQEGHDTPTPHSHAYQAAALAAQHPHPTALVNAATEVMPMEGRNLQSLLKSRRVLSSDDIKTISRSLLQKLAPKKSMVPVPELTPGASEIISSYQKQFEDHQYSIYRRVEAALQEYACQTGHEYEIHVICGVNAEIPEDGKFGYFHNQDGYPCCHINLWATRKGSQHDGTAPTLLFIECSNDEDMKDVPFLCCPVSESSKDAGRCFHCECDGAKIVHPPSKMYLGCSRDFEDMAHGKHSVTIEEINSPVELMTMSMKHNGRMLEEGSIYFDPAWDTDFVRFINKNARQREKEEELEKDVDLALAWGDKLQEALYQDFVGLTACK